MDVQDTKEPACLRLFLDYQGLPLLWSWMVDVPSTAIDFKTQVPLFTPELLGITEAVMSCCLPCTSVLLWHKPEYLTGFPRILETHGISERNFPGLESRGN